MRQLPAEFWLFNGILAVGFVIAGVLFDVSFTVFAIGMGFSGILAHLCTSRTEEKESHREFVRRIERENREIDKLLWGFEVRVHERELIEEQEVITQVYNDHSHDRGSNWIFSSGTLHIFRQIGIPYLHLPSDLDESELRMWISTE